MSITLHAQPYDISAQGFYFATATEFDNKAKSARNSFGDPVDEFEIQFIEGDAIDCDLAKAINLNQGNFKCGLFRYCSQAIATSINGDRLAGHGQAAGAFAGHAYLWRG